MTPEAELGLALRLGIRRRRRARPVLGHELVELFLVLGVAQPVEEVLELVLLFFEALQRLDAILIEGAVAARGRTETAKAEAAALHAVIPGFRGGLHGPGRRP